jgi:hypothetical protein
MKVVKHSHLGWKYSSLNLNPIFDPKKKPTLIQVKALNNLEYPESNNERSISQRKVIFL